MKDHMRKFVLALALLSSTSAAFAQQAAQPQRQGTEQEQAACRQKLRTPSLFKKTWDHYRSKIG